ADRRAADGGPREGCEHECDRERGEPLHLFIVANGSYTRAMPACGRCGEANPERARFCWACGARLGGEPPGPLAERKVVTVLFVDLVGFTGRAEQLDPEDVQRLLTPFYAAVRRELSRFGGTVEKFIGDAVMAVFGAPAAHEDDP